MKKLLLGLLLVATNAVAGSPFIFKGSVAKNLAGSGIEISNSSSKQIIDLSVDPRAGAGVAAAIGSIGVGAGSVYVKTGAGDTQWVDNSNATGIAYTPTTAGDWGSVPGTVQQALDYVGDKLTNTPNTLSYFDSNGYLQSLSNWYTGTAFTATQVSANQTFSITSNPGSGQFDKIFSLDADVNPVVSSTNENTYTASFNSSFDSSGVGNNFGGAIATLGVGAVNYGTGTLANLKSLDVSLSHSNAGTTTNSSMITGNAVVQSGHTVTNLNTANIGTTVSAGGIVTNASVLNLPFSGDVVSNFNGITLSKTGTSGAANLFNISNSGNVSGQMNGLMVSNGGDVTGNEALQYLSSTGNSSASFSALGISKTGTIGSTSTVISANLGTGADTTGDITVLGINNQGDATGNSKGIQVLLSGDSQEVAGGEITITGTHTSDTTGLKVNVSGATVNDGGLNRPKGITVDGNMSTNYAHKTVSNYVQLVDYGNILGGSLTVDSGTPITGTDYIHNNMAGSLYANDNLGTSVFGVGYANVGFVGQMAVASGKTVDKYSMALAGGSYPPASTGGTITDMANYRAISPLSAGGTLNITNLYAFKAENTLGAFSSATNAYGIYLDDTVFKNYLGGSTRVGGASYVAPAVALDVTGKIKSDDSLILEDPGAGTNKWTIQSPTLAADYSLTLPVDDGTSGECLKTDGSGVTSWGPCSGGSLSLTDAHIYVGNASNVATDVAVSGDLTLANTGAFTIANSAVTNAKMANMAANTIKGNNTGSPAAPSDLTATQVTAMLNAFVGDSGSGGTQGLVPAPASGDAAAGKYLKADGTWATVPGGLTSPLTTKGDIWVWSTTNARLPVGSDGEILSADSTQTTGLKWISVPSAAPTIFGSRGTPRSVVAATGITSGASHMSTTAVNQKIYVSGSGGAVTVTANPAISAHTVDGAEMKICGRDDTNTVTLTNGNGLSLNGSVTLGADDCITLSWDTTNYVELSRSN